MGSPVPDGMTQQALGGGATVTRPRMGNLDSLPKVFDLLCKS